MSWPLRYFVSKGRQLAHTFPPFVFLGQDVYKRQALCGTVRRLMRKFDKNKELTLILQDQNDTFRTAGCKAVSYTHL